MEVSVRIGLTVVIINILRCIYYSSSALQEKESKIQECEILLQNKQAEFLEQLEQEKASTLALLQVERQMWEAERNKQLAPKYQETE